VHDKETSGQPISICNPPAGFVVEPKADDAASHDRSPSDERSRRYYRCWPQSQLTGNRNRWLSRHLRYVRLRQTRQRNLLLHYSTGLRSADRNRGPDI